MTCPMIKGKRLGCAPQLRPSGETGLSFRESRLVAMTVLKFGLIAILMLGLTGCATYVLPGPSGLGPVAPQRNIATSSERSSHTFIVLAFSGGGTRAAAFSFGVLEALRDRIVAVDGRRRRLLDEVDVVTSVSGGSYTASYWALYGDRIFEDFEQRFLKRDIQTALLSLLMNPLVAAQIALPGYNRSDAAAEWLDQNLFDGMTFADIMRRPSAPALIINASDLNNGITFSFIPQHFALLCSDIRAYRVARAVIASSAVPGVFAPIAVPNRGGDCDGRKRPWVDQALRQRNIYDRNYQVARAILRYRHYEQMPVVRLADGGMTDNLGVRGSMLSPILHDGNVLEMRGAFDDVALDEVANVLVIVANSQIYENYAWSQSGSEPGLIEILRSSFSSAIGIMNTETIGLARRGFEQWVRAVNARPSRAGRAPVKLRFAAITLDDIGDEQERAYFNGVPTTLSLSARQVDEVRALARRLIDTSSEYNGFLSDLTKNAPENENNNE